MLVLAIWLTLLGYTVAITGKRNLGLSYRPQADGSIKAVDDKGNQARAYTLMDVVQCAQPSAAPAQQPPLGAATGGRPAGPAPPPARPQPALRPLPLQLPAFQLPRIQLPEPRPGGLPRLPSPPRLPQPVPGLNLLDTLSRDVYQGLSGGLQAARQRLLGSPSLPPAGALP